VRLIDEQDVRTPFYGVKQMRLHLNRVLAAEDVRVNPKRMRRLMRRMGLGRYFTFYNRERPHQAFGGLTPAGMYGLATPPWPIALTGKAGGAARSAAPSAFALRAHSEASAEGETNHLHSPRCAPS